MMAHRYPKNLLYKVFNMRIYKREGKTFYIKPKTDTEAYLHKVSITENGELICGCKWSQINLHSDRLCSHRLRVLYELNKEKFWEEIRNE